MKKSYPLTAFLVGLVLLSTPAWGIVTQNVTTDETLLNNPNVINPPPSTVDAFVQLHPSAGSVFGQAPSANYGTVGDPYELHFWGQAYQVRTLTVTNVATRFLGFPYGVETNGLPAAFLSINNATLLVPSLIVGDSTRDGYTSLSLENAMHLQSSGFAAIGRPYSPGLLAEGVMTVMHSTSWWHNGFISIGEGSGAGKLDIDGEVSGGLSGDHPNLFVGSTPITRWASLDDSQLSVSGMLYANELTIEGKAHGTGLVSAARVKIQNGGVASFDNLDAGQVVVGSEGSGELGLGGKAGSVAVGNGAGLFARLSVSGLADIGATGNDSSVQALTAGAGFDGGMGEITVSKMVNGYLREDREATLRVNGSARLADGGGSASLNVTHGGQFLATGAVRAATYPGYGATNNRAAILVEGAGSKLSASELWLGANENTAFYGNSGPGLAGEGHLSVRDGGLVEITGRSETYSYSYLGNTSTWTNYSQGRLVAGADSVIDGNGTIRVLDPDPASDGRGTMQVLGTLSPGNSPGWLTIDGNLSLGSEFGNGGRLRIELGGATPGEDYDVLEVMGNLSLRGATLELSLVDGFTLSTASQFQFLRVHGNTSGSFAVLDDRTGLGFGLEDLVFGQDGNVALYYPDSVTAPVPIPGTIFLMLSGLSGLAALRRQKR